MPLLNKLIKTLSVVVMLSSVNVLAGDIPIDHHIVDDRGDRAYGGKNYEIDKMLVNWDSEDQITVDIYTNFGSHNNKDLASSDGRNIIFGDLLIGTNGGNADYNYAFSLGSLTTYEGWKNWSNTSASSYKYKDYERYYSHSDDTSSSYTTGGLYAISDTIASTDYHTNGGVRTGEVFGDISNRNDKAANGTWSVNNSSNSFDIFSFSFNVANIEAFQNASQLSLSWAMSCYNDVVTASIDKNTVAVPTPASALLLLLGLALIAFQRKNKTANNSFSA